jgi:hypothetical protein
MAETKDAPRSLDAYELSVNAGKGKRREREAKHKKLQG